MQLGMKLQIQSWSPIAHVNPKYQQISSRGWLDEELPPGLEEVKNVRKVMGTDKSCVRAVDRRRELSHHAKLSDTLPTEAKLFLKTFAALTNLEYERAHKKLDSPVLTTDCVLASVPVPASPAGPATGVRVVRGRAGRISYPPVTASLISTRAQYY